MTTKRLGWGLGAIVSVIGVVVTVPATLASADSTCYVGCTPPTIGSSGGSGPSPVTKPGSSTSSSSSSSTSSSSSSSAASQAQSGVRTASSSGSLPFTGADVEELSGIGVGALLAGALLVRRSRRRRAEA